MRASQVFRHFRFPGLCLQPRDIDELAYDDFDKLTPEELDALLTETPPAEAVVPEPVEPVVPPAVVPDAPVVSEPAVPAPAEPQRGDPEVPLRQTREELRTAKAQLEQFNQFLNNPQALQAHLAQLQPAEPAVAPDVYDDPQGAINHFVSEAMAPLQQQLQQLQGVLAQTQQRERETALKAKYGDDAPALIQHFDQYDPNHADIDPELKILAIRGAQYSDPAYMQQQVDAKARVMAEKMLADSLAGGKQETPVTLGGVIPASNADADALDINSMDFNAYLKTPEEKLRKAEQGR